MTLSISLFRPSVSNLTLVLELVEDDELEVEDAGFFVPAKS